jgi:hypothetical protein
VCELQQLRFLDFSDNLLTELPESIARLQRLECLLLVFNRLERLPNSICTMINLHLLWLGSNRLRRLPRDFGRLQNLDWGFRHTSSSVVDGNPLVEPPVEICKQGVESIAAYFSRQEEKEGNGHHHHRSGSHRRHHQEPPADDDDEAYLSRNVGYDSAAAEADGYRRGSDYRQKVY